MRQLSAASSLQVRQLNALSRQAAQIDSVKRALAKSSIVDKAVLASVRTSLDQPRNWASLSPRVTAIVDANRSLTRLIEQVGIAKSPISGLFAAQMSATEVLKAAGVSSALTAAALQIGVGSALSASLMAQQKLALLERASIGSLVGANATFRRSAAAHLGNLTRSYQGLMTLVSTASSSATPIPMLTKYPPVEYYRHVGVLESITIPQPDSDEVSTAVETSLEETMPDVDGRLRQLDGRLSSLLAGAREACASDNPDAARHVLTSLRELFTHVLHALAPDDGVRLWAPSSEYFHEGRPTRRARLLYICRDINEGALTKFVQDDVSATLSFLDALNAGTHVLESSLSPTQLNSAVARMESLLVFLLGLRDGT